MPKEEWFDQVLRAMYEPIHQAGENPGCPRFCVRSQAHREIAGVMERLPEDVVIP